MTQDQIQEQLPSSDHMCNEETVAAPVMSAEEKLRIRALRNRQAAHASRERKRQYTCELEHERDQLFEESRLLRSRIDLLEAEKTSLAAQVNLLQSEMDSLRRLILGGSFKLDPLPVDPLPTGPVQESAAAVNVDPAATDLLATNTSPSSRHSPFPLLVSSDETRDPNLLDQVPTDPTVRRPLLRLRLPLGLWNRLLGSVNGCTESLPSLLMLIWFLTSAARSNYSSHPRRLRNRWTKSGSVPGKSSFRLTQKSLISWMRRAVKNGGLLKSAAMKRFKHKN